MTTIGKDLRVVLRGVHTQHSSTLRTIKSIKVLFSSLPVSFRISIDKSALHKQIQQFEFVNAIYDEKHVLIGIELKCAWGCNLYQELDMHLNNY